MVGYRSRCSPWSTTTSSPSRCPELEGLEREIINTSDFTGEIYLRQEGAGRAARHLRAELGAVVARRDAGRLSTASSCPTISSASRPELERGFKHFPARRQRRHQEGRQRALHLRARRQPAGRAGAGLQEFLARLRGHGRLQPGRRHRPRAVALDGGERSRPGRAADGRRALRAVRDADATRASRCEENYRRRFRLAYPNEEMPAARPFRRTPVYDRLSRSAAPCSARISGSRTRSGSRRPASSRSRSRPIAAPTPSRMCAPNATRCAARSASTRPRTTRKYEFTGRGARALLDRVFACRIPKAGPHGARADAEPGRAHHGRSLDRLPRRGPLPRRRLGLRRSLPHALVRGAEPARRRLRAQRLLDAWPASALSGPKARELLQRVADVDVSNEALSGSSR